VPRKINPENRLIWLRALRRFKLGMKARAKLGILDTLCKEVAVERKGQQVWDCPQWEHDRWVTYLYTCMRDDQYPTELVKQFVKTAEVTFLTSSRQPTVSKVLDAVDLVCRDLSPKLREKFGVFD
jgi:hypothetical protein